MKKQDILKKVNEIFIDVLDNEDIVLNETTNSNDIEEWDSLGHIQLIVAIEKSFGIKFKSEDIASWQNVGEMVNRIMQLTNY